MAFPSFLPSAVEQLTEPTSVAIAQQIVRQPIATPFREDPIETACVHSGEGNPPILLIHGFDSSVLEFRRLLPLLAAKHETWAIDLLGFGFTERLPGLAFSPSEIKAHLYAAWQQLIHRPVVLVGASMGGAAAIDFALTYPEAVAKLVLLDSAGFAKGPAVGKFLLPPIDFLAAEFLRRPRVRYAISKAAYHDPTYASQDAALCAALHLAVPRWRQAMIAFTKSGGYNFLSDRIPELTQPTLILWGEGDRILGTQDAARFEQAIADSKLVWIPQCGHVPHLECPQLTAQHMLNFTHA